MNRKKKPDKPVKPGSAEDAALERLAALPQSPGADAGERVHLVQHGEAGVALLIYTTGSGAHVELRVDADTFWATQAQMAHMFGVTQPTVSEHLANIFRDGELPDTEATHRKFRLVRVEGAREVEREIDHYDLNTLISVGYRVGSNAGTVFRMWATDKLFRYLTKGFVIDVQRLKSPDARPNRVEELRKIIQDIRADEANVYREVRELCAACRDYDPKSEPWRTFYARMQNKMFWATVTMVATAVRLERADGRKENMGLEAWSGERPIQDDALIAKNYLAKPEVDRMNRLAVLLLDFIRDQLAEDRIATMAQLERALDGFIKQTGRPLMPTHGVHIPSKAEADEFCKAQYKLFSARRAMLEGEGE